MPDSVSPAADLDKPSFTAKTPCWLWPHVLSLEAPIVAVFWALALGRLHRVPWWPGVLPGLALCVWTIYIADRTLDALSTPIERLDVRHRPYRRFRVVLLAFVLPACIAALGWLGLWVVPGGLVLQCLALGMLVTLYLSIYTARNRRIWHGLLIGAACLGAWVLLNAMPLEASFKVGASILIAVLLSLLLFQNVHEYFIHTIPKEAAGGLLFALGCDAWVHFVGIGGPLLGGALETLLLTALFTGNLTGITDRELELENPGRVRPRSHPALLGFIGFLCVAVIIGAVRGVIPGLILPLTWAVGSGVVLLGILHHQRQRLSAEAYRVLADLAVLAPALAILMVKAAA